MYKSLGIGYGSYVWLGRLVQKDEQETYECYMDSLGSIFYPSSR